MVDYHTDVLIVGGGLTGASCLLACQYYGIQAMMIDSQALQTQSNLEPRPLTLSPASVAILDNLGIWPKLRAYAIPIHEIHISQKGHFGLAHLQNKNRQPLGFVIEMHTINQILTSSLPLESVLAPAQLIAFDCKTKIATLKMQETMLSIHTNLLIAADGTHSTVRNLLSCMMTTYDYQQTAIVSIVQLDHDHKHVAYERFTANGPLAMLPMANNQAGLVWCVPPKNALHLAQQDTTIFLHTLQQTFGYRLGRFLAIGSRILHPLKQYIMPQPTQWPVVFLGNAAHTLHPIAGQGFNLGLRDVASLAQCLHSQPITMSTLETYQAMRRQDQLVIMQSSDYLVKLFSNSFPGLAVLRSAGLMVVNNSQLLQSIIARYARGYGGVLSDLIQAQPGGRNDTSI